MSDIRVLVVEDEAIASAAHAAYVGRLPGFELAGTAPDGLPVATSNNPDRVIRTASPATRSRFTVLAES